MNERPESRARPRISGRSSASRSTRPSGRARAERSCRGPEGPPRGRARSGARPRPVVPHRPRERRDGEAIQDDAGTGCRSALPGLLGIPPAGASGDGDFASPTKCSARGRAVLRGRAGRSAAREPDGAGARRRRGRPVRRPPLDRRHRGEGSRAGASRPARLPRGPGDLPRNGARGRRHGQPAGLREPGALPDGGLERGGASRPDPSVPVLASRGRRGDLGDLPGRHLRGVARAGPRDAAPAQGRKAPDHPPDHGAARGPGRADRLARLDRGPHVPHRGRGGAPPERGEDAGDPRDHPLAVSPLRRRRSGPRGQRRHLPDARASAGRGRGPRRSRPRRRRAPGTHRGANREDDRRGERAVRDAREDGRRTGSSTSR